MTQINEIIIAPKKLIGTISESIEKQFCLFINNKRLCVASSDPYPKFLDYSKNVLDTI